MPKSNICGHIMPTNNLKQVFSQKALVKIEHVRKQSLFVSSDLMVFTQCVCMNCIPTEKNEEALSINSFCNHALLINRMYGL